MASFKALNIESDDESDIEIDDTREIQIEDALKLYQTALRHHAEGPKSYEKAREAYNTLLRSELFQTAELAIDQSHPSEIQNFEQPLQTDLVAGNTSLGVTRDNAPNTLPQVLHLSYKNFGQFLLDSQQAANEGPISVSEALKLFVKALENDETDLDLWTRMASLSATADTSRLTRYCLEAVVEGEEEEIKSIFQAPGLESGFADQQLRGLIRAMQDDVSSIKSSAKAKKLPVALLKKLNPYPFAPLPSKVSLTSEVERRSLTGKTPTHSVISPANTDWTIVGQLILQQLQVSLSEQEGEVGPGSIVTIELSKESAEDKLPSVQDSISAEEIQVAAPSDAVESPIDDIEMGDTVTVQTSKEPESAIVGVSPAAEQQEVQQPTRKRSTDSAGLPEIPDGSRGRSKRLRARESIPDGAQIIDANALDLAQQIKDQLVPFEEADLYVFEIVNDTLNKLGVDSLISPQTIKEMMTEVVSNSPTKLKPKESESALKPVLVDLFSGLQKCTPALGSVLSTGETLNQLSSLSKENGISAFHGYTKPTNSRRCFTPLMPAASGLSAWVQQINSQKLSIHEVALSWIESLLLPEKLEDGADSDRPSRYMQYLWPDDLKATVVKIIVTMDDFMFQYVLGRMAKLDACILEAHSTKSTAAICTKDLSLFGFVETLFELHLDIYSRFKHPSSGISQQKQVSQRDRLERWAATARDILHIRAELKAHSSEFDQLALRHIWASAFHISVCENVSQDYIIACAEDLKSLFQSLNNPVIQVQNNAFMPELSVAAAESELSKINMKDFLMKVFDTDEKDPVVVIETLEPILELGTEVEIEAAPRSQSPDPKPQDLTAIGDTRALDNVPIIAELPERRKVSSDNVPQQEIADQSPLHEIRRFLANCSVSITLSLWQRLREAYENIEYAPKVVSCYLRSLECLVEAFRSSSYTKTPQNARILTLFRHLRIIDEIISRVLSIVKDEPLALDCIDHEHLQSSVTALASLLALGQTLHVFEDMLRVGQVAAPTHEGRSVTAIHSVVDKLHEIQIRSWTLLYYLIGEGMAQNPQSFAAPHDEKFEYLRHVHYGTGTRGYCHSSNRIFLRLCKDELIRLIDVTDGNTRDNEFSQTLHDLYGLKCFPNIAHCCNYQSVPEQLSKGTATQLLDFVMSQVWKVNLRDLQKMELRATVEKVHSCLGRPKQSEDMAMNRKVISQFLKSPIHPIALFRSLGGVGTLSTTSINPGQATIASKGWYFLMGSISLNRFIYQKKLLAGLTEHLINANAFFIQDLEYSIDHWETWYRLAQACDGQIEELASWTADRLNGNGFEIPSFQRAAIHGYTMAVACAVRSADYTPQMNSKMAELYSDFGMRIYASSREPFSSQAFLSKESEYKYYSRDQIFNQPAFPPLTPYDACKFASKLFKKAIMAKPDHWMYHYMLGKSLWKMHQFEGAHGRNNRPTVREVLDAFERSIDVLPDKAFVIHSGRKEPVLEPHYKLVSIVHKLVQQNELSPKAASTILQQTPYAKSIPPSVESDTWEEYVLQILKNLRNTDKSGWHHRMTARAAHVIYDETGDTFMSALGAKSELTQQIFTKTMAVQVWKPENERAGRHFVYTTRYTRFFIKLLVQTNDRASMEALSKRVRKKPHEFFEHSKLWQDLCTTYLKLLRRVGKVPEGHEDSIFKSLSHEEFTRVSGRLEVWSQSQESQSPLLDILRDTIELRRLNNNLMKPLLIDDLVCDTYALLYAQVGPTLVTPLANETPNMNATALGAVQPPPLVLPPGGSNTTFVNTLAPSDNPTNIPGVGVMSATSANNLSSLLKQPMPLLAVPASDQTARSRAKGVGRRELIRKAEAAATRPAAPTPVTAQPSENQTVQVLIESRRRSGAQAIKESSRMEQDDASLPEPAEQSMPPTAHHSEEEESELSDLDEDEDGDGASNELSGIFHDAVIRAGGAEDGSTVDGTPAHSTYATPEPGIEESLVREADGEADGEDNDRMDES